MTDQFDPQSQAPLLPPPGPPADALPPTEQVPAYAPTAPLPMMEPTSAPMAVEAPAIAAAAPTKKGGKGLVIGLSVGLVAVAAAAVVGWMGKSSADSDLSAANDRIAALEADVEARDSQISDLDGQVDGLNTDLETANADLESSQAEVEQLTTANGDLEAKVSDLEAQVQILEEQVPDTSAINDLELDLFEYEVAMEFSRGRGADNITLDQAREMGAAVCAANSRAELADVLVQFEPLFAPGTPLGDVGFVVGSFAGLMCQEHLQSIV